MSVWTTLTRMWLTRSVRPFSFRGEYDQVLPFGGCRGLGLYVHIPFCRRVCAFCPYCKQVYDRAVYEEYMDHLLREIHMVGETCPGKKQVTSLYFGGGSPALAVHRLGEVIAALEEHFVITQGIGVELHPEDVTVDTLKALRAAGVSKISIGIQSFGEKYLAVLGRGRPDPEGLARALEAVPFETVSMDFIFALPGQGVEDLIRDVETAFSIGANHVAVYPFIPFACAQPPAMAMEKGEKRRLLDQFTRYCREKGYHRDSIWTFSSAEEARYSSMTRDNFLGFGCSATTLLEGQFKINTFSVAGYNGRVDAGRLPTALTLRFTRRQRMVYYLFWTAYTTRVEEGDFQDFFGVPLKRMYGLELWAAQRMGFVRREGGAYVMTPKGAFYYHYYEQFYTLAYIDKMWGVLRREAFPPELTL